MRSERQLAWLGTVASVIVAGPIPAWVVGCAADLSDAGRDAPRPSDHPTDDERTGSAVLVWPERMQRERASAAQDARLQPVRRGGSVRLAQPGGPSVRITPEGARVAIGERELGLRVVAIGRDGAAARLADAPPVIEGTEVQRELAPGITEWWRALPSGLEHGVTLAERPAGDGALTVEVAVEGLEVRARSQSGVAFHDAAGRIGRYEQLLVLDAESTRVPARMRLASRGVAIEVDDREASYPLVIDPLVLSEEATLLAAGGAEDDRFGRAVALSADGNRALVGAPADDTAGGQSAGSVRVFVRSSATWSEEATLLASRAAAHDFFGSSVALSADGSRALVGVPHDDTGGIGAGSARVFVRSGASWSEEATLLASDGAADDSFGCAVALSADGSRALVGAYGDDTAGGEDGGSARVFVRSGASWSEEATLLASGAARDLFGISVALSADASRALVGVPDDSARVFVRSGASWREEASLLASGGTPADDFAVQVALSADGSHALVAAPGDSTARGTNTGSVRVFVRSGGSWSEEATLLASDGEPGDHFGDAVALSADASRALVGLLGDDTAGPYAGSARVFVRSGGSWSEAAPLAPGAPGDRSGSSVALSADGSRALVGAYTADTAGGVDAGSARVFTLLASSGAPCATGSECPTGFCTDGVCCESACGGGALDCQACSVAAGGTIDGECGPLSAAVAPTVTCRAAAGACDAAERCTSSSTACPANAFAPATTECRAAADVCDVAEACSGSSAACPSDAFAPATAVCRASAGECDLVELCTGSSAACPTDAAQPAGTACGGAPSDDCDVQDQCSGGASCEARVAAAGTACRAASCSAGIEIPAASCDGASAACPAATTTACAPFVCGAHACATTCASHADCAGGNLCTGGACVCTDSACVVDAGPLDAGAEQDGGARDAGMRRWNRGGCGCSVPARDGRRGLPARFVLALALLGAGVRAGRRGGRGGRR